MKRLIAVALFSQMVLGRDLVKIAATSREVVDGETGIRLTISTGTFWIAPAEVTQAEYEAITGGNPSVYRGANRPVENVSWFDAIRYLNLRSQKEGLEPCYDLVTGRSDRSRNGYRLPSDAEWEAAAEGSVAEGAHLGMDSTKDAAPLVERIRRTGTREVAAAAASAKGLYDMLGNVWEWTDDAFRANSAAAASNGPMRIIRGGSFVSTRSRWSGGYRSSMEPDHKSRFLGFRVVRSAAAEGRKEADESWFTAYNQPPAGFESSTGGLTALFDAGSPWPEQRGKLLEKWRGIVGTMKLAPLPPRVRRVETFSDSLYGGEVLQLQTEPDAWERILILRPHRMARTPAPVVIVPYYDVDTPAGRNLGGRNFMPGGVRAFAQVAAQRGWIAVAIRWFGESYGERYDEAVANLAMRHPEVTGLGKWVWDAQRLVDYLYTLPEVDRGRIGIIGHSLGAKMALYAAALDERIGPVVFSEGGIGFSMSNYDDYWYLGPRLRTLPAGTDQHELLALLAPRPFLLIGGDEYDGAKSWHYIHAARRVYESLGQPRRIGYFNHHSGHSPTPEAVWQGMGWLEKFLSWE